MKKYVFSWIHFSDNVLISKIILSDLGPFEVALEELIKRGWDFTDYTDVNNIEDLKNYAFEADCMFEIIEV